MNRPIHSKTFKSGNSVAMRLPKALGIPAGADVELLRNGNRVTIQLSVDPAAAKRRWLAALDALERLPMPGAIEQREPIEFPDRPGL
jgi:antitoxin VapB